MRTFRWLLGALDNTWAARLGSALLFASLVAGGLRVALADFPTWALIMALLGALLLGVGVVGPLLARMVGGNESGQYALLFDSLYCVSLWDVAVTPKVIAGVAVGVNFKNRIQQPITYAVEHMSVVVNGKTVPAPNFTNRGGLLLPDQISLFRFPQIGVTRADLEAGIEIDYTVTYGRFTGPTFRRKHAITAWPLINLDGEVTDYPWTEREFSDERD